MRDYFIRRFLLLVPTLLVITMIVFGVTRIAPGGPLEQAMMEAQTVSMEGGGGSNEGAALSEEQLKQMEELYGYDKPIHEAYLIWLGVIPRELNKREVVFENESMTGSARMRVPSFHVAELDWDRDGYVQKSEIPESIESYVNFDKLDANRDSKIDGYEAELPQATIERPREKVKLVLDENGQVVIENLEDTMVPWEVRMVHPLPYKHAVRPLEQGLNNLFKNYNMESKATQSRLEEWGRFEADAKTFVKDSVAISKQRWNEAFKSLKDAEYSKRLSYLQTVVRALREADDTTTEKKDRLKSLLLQCAKSLTAIQEASKATPTAEVYRKRYSGVLQGDLGTSFRHGEPVLSMMFDRLPISTFYGLLTFFFTFLICVPLGIAKAMKHNTWFDNGSSIFIFMGYSVPGYVLGALTVVFLAARLELFPTGGFVGPNYESTPIANVSVKSGSSEWTAPGHRLKNGQEVWLEGDLPAAIPLLEEDAGYVVAVKDDNIFELLPESGTTPVLLQGAAAKVGLYRHTGIFERIKDLVWHAVLPLLCYLVGSFAFVTMLMKNHLMDNLSADYMRTAISKGVPFSQAVRRHALRNSLIPLATNLGHQITLFVAGSFLIETIFDINGFGLLGFKSVLDRDIPVVMGIFLLSATLMLLGNIISDILVALVDPRVRFN
jgi:ABC-type dipeptide/oligopeptide/nickel transport system permease component